MDRHDRPVREHARPDEHDLRDDTLPAAASRPSERPSFARPRRGQWLLPIALPILSLIVIAIMLSSCELGVALGLGLPRNDACRDVDTSPGQPISNDCLDSIGKSPATP
jgi:hypothetical protein